MALHGGPRLAQVRPLLGAKLLCHRRATSSPHDPKQTSRAQAITSETSECDGVLNRVGGAAGALVPLSASPSVMNKTG